MDHFQGRSAAEVPRFQRVLRRSTTPTKRSNAPCVASPVGHHHRVDSAAQTRIARHPRGLQALQALRQRRARPTSGSHAYPRSPHRRNPNSAASTKHQPSARARVVEPARAGVHRAERGRPRRATIHPEEVRTARHALRSSRDLSPRVRARHRLRSRDPTEPSRRGRMLRLTLSKRTWGSMTLWSQQSQKSHWSSTARRSRRGSRIPRRKPRSRARCTRRQRG